MTEITSCPQGQAGNIVKTFKVTEFKSFQGGSCRITSVLKEELSKEVNCVTLPTEGAISGGGRGLD